MLRTSSGCSRLARVIVSAGTALALVPASAAAAAPTLTAVTASGSIGELRPGLVSVSANASERASAKTSITILLSKDKRRDKADIAVSGVVSLPALKKGKKTTVTRAVAWPAEIASRRVLLACAGKACVAAKKKLAPKPAPPLPSATPTLDAGHGTFAVLDARGGSLTTSDAAGNRYTLTIPARVLPNETPISLTPVTALAPAQGRIVAAALLEPVGLLVPTAKLEITPPKPLTAAMAAFGFGGATGKVFGLPLLLAPKAIFSVDRFGGYGIREPGAAAAARARAAAAGGPDPCAATAARAATASPRARASKRLGVKCLDEKLEQHMDEAEKRARKAIGDERARQQAGHKPDPYALIGITDDATSLSREVDGLIDAAADSKLVTDDTLAELMILLNAGIALAHQKQVTGGSDAVVPSMYANLITRALKLARARCTLPKQTTSQEVLRDAQIVNDLARTYLFATGSEAAGAGDDASACLKRARIALDVLASGTQQVTGRYDATVATDTKNIVMTPTIVAPGYATWAGSAPPTYTVATATKAAGSSAKSTEITQTGGTINPAAAVRASPFAVCVGGRATITSPITISVKGTGLFMDAQLVTEHYDGYDYPIESSVIRQAWQTQFQPDPTTRQIPEKPVVIKNAEVDGAKSDVRAASVTYTHIQGPSPGTYSVQITAHPLPVG